MNGTMRKITKAQVKALAKRAGHIDVQMFPSNCGPANTTWVQGAEFRVVHTKQGELHCTTSEGSDTFEGTINMFSYYNCNSELGNRIHYYVDNSTYEAIQQTSKPRYD